MNRTYAISEIVGTSTKGVGDAIESAIATANQTLKHLEWFEVGQIRGHIEDGKVAHFQVTVKLGFRYERQ
jgi:flavin-binding protein dodecin